MDALEEEGSRRGGSKAVAKGARGQRLQNGWYTVEALGTQRIVTSRGAGGGGQVHACDVLCGYQTEIEGPAQEPERPSTRRSAVCRLVAKSGRKSSHRRKRVPWLLLTETAEAAAECRLPVQFGAGRIRDGQPTGTNHQTSSGCKPADDRNGASGPPHRTAALRRTSPPTRPSAAVVQGHSGPDDASLEWTSTQHQSSIAQYKWGGAATCHTLWPRELAAFPKRTRVCTGRRCDAAHCARGSACTAAPGRTASQVSTTTRTCCRLEGCGLEGGGTWGRADLRRSGSHVTGARCHWVQSVPFIRQKIGFPKGKCSDGPITMHNVV